MECREARYGSQFRKEAVQLTDSIDPSKDAAIHSRTDRIASLRMHTMSLFEMGCSSGEVSLSDLFRRTGSVSGISNLRYDELSRILVRGGLSETIGMDDSDAQRFVEGYCESVLNPETDLPDRRRRNRAKMRSLLGSLSRHTAMIATNTAILKDMEVSGEETVSINTITDYISVLRELSVVDDLGAWSPDLRSRSVVRTSDVRYMADPAIAAFYLGAGAGDLENDPKLFERLFKSLVLRDMRVYVQAMGGRVYHYRDSDDLKVDLVVHLNDGRWGAMEIKLGHYWVEEGARNLHRLARKIDVDRMGPPSFLAVVIGFGYAYTREDGIHVVPIGCLRDRRVGPAGAGPFAHQSCIFQEFSILTVSGDP